MELKPGHKQTEVGVIPEDWEVKQIGELRPFVTSGSRGWAAFYSDSGSPFIRITNLSRSCIYLNLDDLRFVNIARNDSEGTRTQLQNGDVLISITADIGIIGYISEVIPSPSYINQHIALMRFDPAQTSSRYVSYYLASANPQKHFRALTDSGAKAGMNLTTVQQIRLVLPPTLAEQRDIAEALSDADALIEALEQLIAKKRAVKQGAMQELLTGKRRLPGFSAIYGYKKTELGIIPEDWEVKRLANVCSMKSGEGVTSDDIDEFSPFRCYGGNGIRGYVKRYTHDGYYAIIGRQGALCGNVLGVSGKFFASEHAIVVTSSPQSDIRWLTFVLDNMNLNRFSESSAQPGLSVEKLLGLPLAYVPTKAEQTAIAAVLSDMDAEIEALEAKLAKARQVKQGMMQELLTGRVRLV